MFGRDSVHVHTVAFGPAAEDYKTLKDIANVLPRGSFSKLGLSANALRTAFSSLTSSLTTLRSDASASGLTERRIQKETVGCVCVRARARARARASERARERERERV